MKKHVKDLFATLSFVLLFVGTYSHAQESRWVETQSWSGIGSKQTEMFVIEGARWRIRYGFRGSGLFQVAVYDADSQFVDIVADLRVPVYGRKTRTGRGKFYLAVTGIDTRWNVTVEQYLSVIEEWRLTKMAEEPLEPLVKIGTWVGEDGHSEHELEIPTGRWVVEYEGEGSGFAQIILHDSDGKVIVGVNMEEPHQGRSWGHQPGIFKMKVTAADMDWKVNILAETAATGVSSQAEQAIDEETQEKPIPDE